MTTHAHESKVTHEEAKVPAKPAFAVTPAVAKLEGHGLHRDVIERASAVGVGPDKLQGIFDQFGSMGTILAILKALLDALEAKKST